MDKGHLLYLEYPSRLRIDTEVFADLGISRRQILEISGSGEQYFRQAGAAEYEWRLE